LINENPGYGLRPSPRLLAENQLGLDKYSEEKIDALSHQLIFA